MEYFLDEIVGETTSLQKFRGNAKHIFGYKYELTENTYNLSNGKTWNE